MTIRTISGIIYRRAFTLIEILVVIIIISVLYTVSQPLIGDSTKKAKESVLRNNLRITREVISRFYKDNERYPAGINELVAKRYLVTRPVDPITERDDTWVEIPSKPGERDLYDIKSGAAGKTLDGADYNKL